uniref:Serine/threonine-protein phosphatase n=2 Tax=Aceria tosichella TaxID=561515 RepID=A0A6G1SLJ5_9ACAR
MSASQRRQSETALDPSHLGHRVLTLIRGFWSQVAWPRGRQMSAKQQQTQEQLLKDMYRVSANENAIDTLITYFRSTTFYPHKRTLGHMSMAPVSPPPPPLTQSAPATGATGGSRRSSGSHRHKHQSSSNLSTHSGGSGTRRKGSTIGIVSSGGSRIRSGVSSTRVPLDSSSYYMSWIPRNKDLIAEMVDELCKRVEEVFMNEARILSISSPCTVLGDIHGNLLDLRTYERSLWPKAPSCLTSNYLFLGDYVDRGEHSVECVLYLFAMKLIAPNRFYLLRGNHEIASIQRQYTFGSECETKFGSAGKQLFRSFNKVFNVMPIAAIIDEQIFCAHGGIPRSATDISQLAQDIPTPLDNPEVQSPAAWEILWNDPITDSELVSMIEMDSTAIFPGTAEGNLPPPSSTQQQPQEQQPQQQQQPQQPAPKASLPTAPTDGTTSSVKSSTGSTPTTIRRPSPFESALSFYIKPADQTQQQHNKDKTSSSSNDGGRSGPRGPPVNVNQPDRGPPPAAAATPTPTPTPAAAPVAQAEKSDGNDTLRTVPSDTSSIASTSPAQLLNDGFVANIKRGTAFLFSDRAIDHFLEVNKFSHVIRAHEVIPTGFAFHGDGRVITIFSSSQYCGLNNQAACALVDSERIRILRLDTGDAGD